MEEIRRRLEEDFIVYDEEKLEDGVRFYIHPKREMSEDLKRYLMSLMGEYSIQMKERYGELVLEIRKHKRDRIWINVVLFLATVCSTAFMGYIMFGTPLKGLVFSTAVMFVLGSHEMGHYFAAKRWRMRTSLPYFIPFPTIIGTLGAIIKHRGPIPNRRALFDVGVSGPLVGVLASLIAIVIGLKIPLLPKELSGPVIVLGTPPLFDFIAKLMNYNEKMIGPIAFAGWVGLFVTFLNLIPVGQLDGGHVLRAMIGKRANIVSRTIPPILIAVGMAISYIYNVPDSIWIFWGLITVFFAMIPHPDPIDDETPLDGKRIALGIITFIIAFLCFTPVPFRVVT